MKDLISTLINFLKPFHKKLSEGEQAGSERRLNGGEHQVHHHFLSGTLPPIQQSSLTRTFSFPVCLTLIMFYWPPTGAVIV